MFSVRQPYPMLLAAHRSLSPAEFEGLLSATVVIAFRYIVIGEQRTSDQERLYHQPCSSIAVSSMGWRLCCRHSGRSIAAMKPSRPISARRQ